MAKILKEIKTWCSKHVWQSAIIAIALIGVIVSSITLPIILNKKGNSFSLDRVIYGNIITMDEANSSAEAVGIKDGKIVAVGTKDEIGSLTDGKTVVDDFTGNFVYPGFVDAHSHYALMGNVMGGAFLFDREKPGEYELGDYEAYANLIKQYIELNPDKEFYYAYGFWAMGEPPTAKILDEFCPTDKPIVVIGSGGHDCWTNTAAIKTYIGNFDGNSEEKEAVTKWINEVGKDCVITTQQQPNVPTGYFCETARFRITDQLPHPLEETKEVVRNFQDLTLSKGYTTIGDCSIIENDLNKEVTAFKQLRDAGELKLKYRSYYEIKEYDSKETRKSELEYAIKLAKETKGDDYFEVIGIKVFLDGVYEALSAYTSKPYTQESGKYDNYKGIQRWYGNLDNDLKELVFEANKAGLAMEFHAMGDAAIKQALDACEYAANKLGVIGTPNFRNCISHLGYIDPADIGRFKTLGVTAVVAPQWASANKTIYEQEKKCLGSDKVEQMFLINTLINTGANVAFHTDGAVLGGVPEMIYDATTRGDAASQDSDVLHVRGEAEKITGLESLKCLTNNAAYAVNSEYNLGSIKVGYAADFTVYNKDYRDNAIASSLAAFNEAKLLALIVNGKSLDLS